MNILRPSENRTDGLQWTTEFQDEERRKYHEQKMISKDSRPAAQLAQLGNSITQGTVHHITKLVAQS